MADDFRSSYSESSSGVGPAGKFISFDDNEQAKLKKFESWFSESQELFDKRKEWCSENKDQYLGKHIKKEKAKHRSKVVHNKQFENVETIVPYLTKNLPAAVPATPNKDPKVMDAARTVVNGIKYIGRNDRFDLKGESIIRDMLLNRDAIVSPMWDPNKGKFGDVTIEVIAPGNVRVDPNSTYEYQGEYFFKLVPRSYRWCVSQYPEHRAFLKEAHGKMSEGEDNEKKEQSMLPLREVWYWMEEETGQFNIWRDVYMKEKVLESSRNPYWDFDGELPVEEDQALQEAMIQAEQAAMVKGVELTDDERLEVAAPYESKRYFKNFLDRQMFPSITFSTFIDYSSPFSATSQIEQTTGLQRSLNKRKQQIEDNANLMANNQWVADSNCGIPKTAFNNAAGGVYMKTPGSDVRKESGAPMPDYVFRDKEDTERAIDGIFGANDIIKGVVGKTKTYAEAALLKESNEGRIALLQRHYEAGFEQVYRWVVHLMKLFYNEERQIVLFNENGGFESFQAISSDTIPDDMQVYVVIGSAKPIDDNFKRIETLEHFRDGLISPLTALRRLGDYEDPEAVAKEAFDAKNGTLFQPPQPGIEEQAHQENDAILKGEEVPPNPEANPIHIQIHTDLMGDIKNPLTSKQMADLEEHVGLETAALKARKDEEAAKAAQVPVPVDLAQEFPDQVPEDQLEEVAGQLPPQAA